MDDLTTQEVRLLANFIGSHWAEFDKQAKEAGIDSQELAQKLDDIADDD